MRLVKAKVDTRQAKPFSARQDRSYLVTGGLGKLGRQAAQWLLENGAGQLILVSRRPPDAATEAWIDSLAGNVVIHSADMNMLSVLEFAIFGLGVKEIMITGHYGCGGVRASLEDPTGALVDHWLEPVRRLSQVHAEELARAESHEAKVDRLCELNVLEGVRKLADSPIMREAWKRGLNINLHGLCYGLKDGLLRDMHCTITPEDAKKR